MSFRRYYANFAPTQTLASGITNTSTSLSIAGSFVGWPTNYPFFAVLEYGTASAEIVQVTNIVGTTATITRGQDGTPAIAHLAGANFDFAVVRQDLDDANSHINSTSGVHGVSGTVVGTNDTQTLSNKTLNAPVVHSPTTDGGTITGTTLHNTTSTGDASNPALVGVAGVSTSKVLSIRNASAVEKAYIDDSGNIWTGGTLGGAAFQPTVLANEASASAVFPSPVLGTQIWLTTPTGANYKPGPFFWNGSAWVPFYRDTGWLNLTGFANGFTNSGSQARQLNGVVYLRGGLTNSTFSSSSGTIAAQLPSGIFAPTQTMFFSPSPTSSVSDRIVEIDTSGNILIAVVNSVASSAAYHLDGICYPVG